jgi:hypothetical protein
MTAQTARIPDAGHPITVERNRNWVAVTVTGRVRGERAVHAGSTCEALFDAMGAIKDYPACYPDRVDALDQQPAA